jgi:hypothetical protein
MLRLDKMRTRQSWRQSGVVWWGCAEKKARLWVQIQVQVQVEIAPPPHNRSVTRDGLLLACVRDSPDQSVVVACLLQS